MFFGSPSPRNYSWRPLEASWRPLCEELIWTHFAASWPHLCPNRCFLDPDLGCPYTEFGRATAPKALAGPSRPCPSLPWPAPACSRGSGRHKSSHERCFVLRKMQTPFLWVVGGRGLRPSPKPLLLVWGVPRRDDFSGKQNDTVRLVSSWFVSMGVQAPSPCCWAGEFLASLFS